MMFLNNSTYVIKITDFIFAKTVNKYNKQYFKEKKLSSVPEKKKILYYVE